MKCSDIHHQFSSGMRHFLQVVCVAMASFAEGYHRHKQSSMACATVSFLNSGKYTVNPEMRAKMIVDVTQKTNMEFCKAFWSLTEGYGLQVLPAAECFPLTQLTIGSYVSVHSSRCEAHRKFGEHERSIRVAQGIAKNNSSFLSALQTSQVLHILMNAQLTYEPIVL